MRKLSHIFFGIGLIFILIILPGCAFRDKLQEYGDNVQEKVLGKIEESKENALKVMEQKVTETKEELKQRVEDKVDEVIDDVKEEVKEEINETIEEGKEKIMEGAGDLKGKITQKVKKKIDEWIVSQGLNYYGDTIDTIYEKGSPLVDEVTGEVKDRYEYILEKYPKLLEKWGL